MLIQHYLLNMKNENKAIILFDGQCKLCNGSVRFISNRDHENFFNYVTLESEEAKKILAPYGENIKDLDSVLLILNGKLMIHSTAVVTIARHLAGWWPMLYGFIIIPKFIRDPLYKIMARKRHKWFGRI